jgi:phage protein D
MDKPRRAWVEVEYDGQDITEAVTAGLISVMISDNNGEANEVRITVEDIDGNWAGPWYPKIGTRPSGG